MEPIATSEVFAPDDGMEVTERADGSAIVDLPAQPVNEKGFYTNLAEQLDPFELNKAAGTLLELIEKDTESRKKRDEQYEEGLRRTGLGDDAPGGAEFDGASRVVHPVLAEGCVDFAARAIKELVPPGGPVKTKILGEADDQKLEKAKRKRDYLNWLLTSKIKEYRAEKEILLTQLPLGGSQYEKYWFDPTKKRICMEFVPIDKVLLPFSASSFYTSPRVTHIQDVTRAEFEARIASGFYRDVRIQAPGQIEQTAPETANDKIEGVEADYYNIDGLRRVYEVSCDFEFGEDGSKPYVVHVDEPTQQIVAIYRNWSEEDATAEQLDWWVEDKFIPWRGAYGIGLPHLIGGLASALTGAMRALLDSAHINNSPGAVKLKGGRTSGQNLQVPQTGVVEMDAPAGVDDIRKVMMPLPFNPPSAVLFQLLDWITNQAKGVVATAEEKIADASNQMPVGTALALIEQGSQVFSSIHSRLHEAQRRALEIVCRLIRQYPEAHAQDLARFQLTPQDFADTDDVQPVSDPLIFSEAQRYAQLQEQMKVVQFFPEQNWNRNELARRALELLRTEGVDSLLPKPPPPVSADPVTENVAIATGQVIKATIMQDHLAHAMAHVGYVLNPVHQLTPGPQPYLMGLLQHVAEHMVLYYQLTAQAMLQQVMIEAAARGEPLGPDQAAMRAAQAAQQLNASLIQELASMVQQATPIAQQKLPPPQLPPDVQATKDVAMAEIQRKGQETQQRLAFDKEATQAKLGLDERLANMSEVFNMQLAQQKEESAQQLSLMDQQLQLLKNREDNASHAATELRKNKDDNDTAIIVEQLKQHFAPMLEMVKLAAEGRAQQAAGTTPAPANEGE